MGAHGPIILAWRFDLAASREPRNDQQVTSKDLYPLPATEILTQPASNKRPLL
jgi:hypothetical protein